MLKGTCVIQTNYNNRDEEVTVDTNRSYTINQNVWHKGINNTQEQCHILEVQFGEHCIEQDIERKEE